MNRSYYVILVIALLLAGCSAPATKHTPSPPTAPAAGGVQQSPAEGATPPVEAAPAHDWFQAIEASESLCKAPAGERDTTLLERAPALLDGRTTAEVLAAYERYQKQQGWPQCVEMMAFEGSEALLLQLAWADDGKPVVLAWQEGKAWETARVRLAKGDRWWDHYLPTLLRFTDGRPEIVLTGQAEGTGQFAALLVGRPDNEGDISLAPLTKTFGKVAFDLMAEDLILVTYREGYGKAPLLWGCNACLGSNHQILYRWDWKSLTEVGRRLVSTPDLTANLFLGALAQGDRNLAASHLVDPSLYDKALKVLGTSGDWNDTTWGDPLRAIQAVELRNWDLLPEGQRGSLGPDQGAYPYLLGSGQTLHMVRTEAGWQIADVTN